MLDQQQGRDGVKVIDFNERRHRSRQAAKLLGCSEWRVYRDIRKGQLRAIKLGNRFEIPESELNRYLTARSTSPELVAA